MCGIAGLIDRYGHPDLAGVLRMQERLVHRGPDDQGVHTDGPAMLAHTRLSIIDVAGGKQPLFARGSAHCLIANGEIYNSPDLRRGIPNDEYAFKTGSDCEVILPLFARLGPQCVNELRGMFAFALWDAERRKLLLARDRMGEKPLYYYFDDRTLVFSSELRSLLASGLVPCNLDPTQLARYFLYQYVPEPHTPFAQIHKVPAGTVLELDVDTWELAVTRYWSPWDAPPIDAEPEVAIRAALEDAVSSALLSDVPIGLSLSGGIDSSILACLMRQNTSRDIHAVSIGYPDASGVDERPQARELATRLGLIFHDVELHDEDMIEAFPAVAVMRDDPIGDLSGYNYYAIMRHARDHGIKVMLQGHGIDELCWGYPWVRDAVSINEGGRRDQNSAGSLAGAARDFMRRLTRREVVVPPSGGGFRMFDLQPYTAWVMRNAGALFTPEFFESSGWRSSSPAREYGDTTMRPDLEVTRLIVEFYLRENGIAQGDRLSMANSVEVRLPFVDHKFVETVIGLRKHHRDDQLPLKHWIKQSVRDLLGDEILNRPKRGFAPPGVRWQEQLRVHFGDMLRDGCLVESNILDPAMAARLAQPSLTDSCEAIVSRMAITLEFWMRGVVHGDSSLLIEPSIARSPAHATEGMRA